MKEMYERLANAVIVLAVKDYRRARKGLQQDEVSRIERFFLGPTFGILTYLEGTVLLQELKKEGGTL